MSKSGNKSNYCLFHYASFFMLTSLAFVGQWVFDLFNISINGLKTVGRFLFFRMGFEMLSGRTITQRHANRDDQSQVILITSIASVLMGLVLVLIGVEFFSAVVTPYIRKMVDSPLTF